MFGVSCFLCSCILKLAIYLLLGFCAVFIIIDRILFKKINQKRLLSLKI